MTAKNLDHSTSLKPRFKIWWKLRKDTDAYARKLLWSLFTGQALKWQENNPHISFFTLALDDEGRKEICQLLHAKDAALVAKGNMADMFGPSQLVEEALKRKNPQMLDHLLWAPKVSDIVYGQELCTILQKIATQISAEDRLWIGEHILKRLEHMATFEDPFSHGLSVAMGAARHQQTDLILWLWSKKLLPTHPKDVTDMLCETLIHTPSGQILNKIIGGMSHHTKLKLTSQAANLNEETLVFNSQTG